MQDLRAYPQNAPHPSNFGAKFSHMTFFNFIQNVGKQHVLGFAIDNLRFGIQDESKETRRLVIHSFFLNYFFCVCFKYNFGIWILSSFGLFAHQSPTCSFTAWALQAFNGKKTSVLIWSILLLKFAVPIVQCNLPFSNCKTNSLIAPNLILFVCSNEPQEPCSEFNIFKIWGKHEIKCSIW